jgi:hypothetical protein
VVDFRSDWALSWGRPMSRLGQHDVGHEGVITGCDALSLRSPSCSLQGLICDADPQGVAQSPLQSTYIQGIRLNKYYPQLLVMSPIFYNYKL